MRADAALLDLGISSMQVDNRERGFSDPYDAPLDMRMDPIGQELSAREIVAGWDARPLARCSGTSARSATPGAIASAIVRRRRRAEITTTQELVEGHHRGDPRCRLRFAAGHPAKRVFQALRIAVNDELGQLDEALPLAWALLAPGGALAVISFHSLEDRRVKHFMADLARSCICPPDLPVCGLRPYVGRPAAAVRRAGGRAGAGRQPACRLRPHAHRPQAHRDRGGRMTPPFAATTAAARIATREKRRTQSVPPPPPRRPPRIASSAVWPATSSARRVRLAPGASRVPAAALRAGCRAPPAATPAPGRPRTPLPLPLPLLLLLPRVRSPRPAQSPPRRGAACPRRRAASPARPAPVVCRVRLAPPSRCGRAARAGRGSSRSRITRSWTGSSGDGRGSGSSPSR